MAKINRSEIEQNSGYRHSVETVQNNVASNSWKSLVTVPYRSMDENRALILRAVGKARKPLSRSEICKAINRKKSPSMVALMESLVEAGFLKREHEVRPNGVVMYYYTATRRVDADGFSLPNWVE